MKNHDKNTKVYSKDEIEDALAALIASTRRVRRKLNLLEIAQKLEIARTGLGSLDAVADAIGLSSEMLRQFSRVDKLTPSVKKFLADGTIQSVDIAERLSRLPIADQLPVAQSVIKDKLNSADVRAIVSLKKVLPKKEITKVIDCIKGTRNIREYVVEFLVPSYKKETDIKEQLKKFLVKENVISCDCNSGIGVVVLNAKGKRHLESIAKQKGLTKLSLINKIVSGDIK